MAGEGAPPLRPVPQVRGLLPNPLAFLTHGWFTPVLGLGWRQPLTIDNLPLLSEGLTTGATRAAFDAAFVRRTATKPAKPARPLAACLLELNARYAVASLALQLVQAGLQFAGPLLLKRVVLHLQTGVPDQKAAYIDAGLMFIFPLLGALAFTHSSRAAASVQVRVRAQLTAAVYRKAMRLSPAARRRADTETGRVVTLMATDVGTIAQFVFPFANQLVSAPIMLVTALALLYAQIRWATFIGLAVLLASSPTSTACVKRITRLRRAMLAHTDARVRLTNQLISGCRTLKLYGWEAAHEAAVLKERDAELGSLRAAVPARVGMQTLLFAAPVLAAVASFTAYGLAEPARFVPSNIFTAIALFSLMRLPLILLPFALVEAGNATVSAGRLARFLLLPDRDDSAVSALPGGAVGLRIEGASFFWPPEEEDEAPPPSKKKAKKEGKKAAAAPPAGSTALELDPDHAAAASTAGRPMSRVASTRYGAAAPAGATAPDGAYWLAGIDLTVGPGDLVAVVGRVGAGKSSLLSAALGDMVVAQGSVSSGGRVAFAAQTPWVANATVQENVLFGRPYDADAYADAISAAALEADLAVLADGDATEIGEKGVNLSGGQKARVALARAAYSGADLFLLDDPLSAVDVHVGAHIAAELLVSRLKNRGKAVLLATNQLSILKDCTRVIYLENGRIAAAGSVDDCRKAGGFASMLADYEATLASAGGGGAAARASRSAALATEATAVPGLEREPAAPAPRVSVERTRSDAVRSLARVPTADIAREARAEALHDGVAGTRVGSGAITPLDSAAFDDGDGRPEPATPRGRRASIGERIVDLVAGRPSGDLARASGDRRASSDAQRPPSRLSSDARRPPSRLSSDAQPVAPTKDAGKPAAPAGGAAGGGPAPPAKGALVAAEDQETGAVTGAVYAWYAARYGPWAAGALLLLWTAEQSARVLTNWWLSRWTAAEAAAGAGGPPSNRGLRLGVYLGLSLVFVACTSVRAATNLLGALRASRAVHAAALRAVARAPVSWYDATPVGRTLNRFSKDTDELDYLTPQSVNDFGNCAMQIMATLVFEAIVQPLFMAGAVPILGLYYLVQLFYRRTYVELQRNDAVTRSPVYAHFAESLAGVDTVRAYGRAGEYRAASDAAVDRNHTAFFAARCADQWLSLRLELCGSALVALVTALAVATRGRIPPSLAAMAMAEALDLVGFLKYAVQSAAMFEARFNSVERLRALAGLPSEASPTAAPGSEPPADWPAAGAVAFEDVVLRYRADLDPALRGVSFEVAPRDKVGIVGRTGSGKSSLIVALFRLTEVASGRILIDGIDLASVGLLDVRSRVAVVPQSPTLFSGTLRFNLDPYDRATDAAIWAALDVVGCRAAVAESPLGLYDRVTEGGDNFSVGFRQLLCVARAVLREPRVLVADEATASVDGETDAAVQRALRTAFAGATVLTVAHRIGTVLDSTRVLVMDAGRVAEYDTVPALMAKPGGLFRALVDGSGG